LSKDLQRRKKKPRTGVKGVKGADQAPAAKATPADVLASAAERVCVCEMCGSKSTDEAWPGQSVKV